MESVAIMGRVEVDFRSHRHQAGRIDGRMADVVVLLDMIHAHGLRPPGNLKELTGVGPEVRVVHQTAQVAFEVPDIDRVKAQQRGEQPPVGFGQLRAEQVALPRQARLQPVQTVEQAGDRHRC